MRRLIAGVLGVLSLQIALAAEALRPFNIPAGIAEKSLKTFASQSGLEVLFATTTGNAIQTNTVKGSFRALDALERLLKDTGLVVVRHEPNGPLTIVRAPDSKSDSSRPGAPRAQTPEPPSSSSDKSASMTTPKNPLALLFGWLALVSSPGSAASSGGTPTVNDSRSTGTIAGRVFNADTGEYVRNAEVRISGATSVVYSGDDGSYRLLNVPPGAVNVTVTYTGYEAQSAALNTSANQVTQRDFEMKRSAGADSIVQMGRMTVTSTIQGNAKALMEQRAAVLVKNVVAADAFGDLSEGNVGELLQYLPGVEISYDQVNMTGVQIGGMGPEYSSVMVDGMRVNSNQASSRQPGLTALNMGAADTVELIKGNSADMDADAPAGTINIKSKNAFQRRGREITWQIYASGNGENLTLKKRGGPSDAEHYQIHPSGILSYSDTFLGDRLGVVAAFEYSHVVHEKHHVNTTYNTAPNATNPDPIVVTQLMYGDRPHSNRSTRGSLNLDYKLTPLLTLSLRGQIRHQDSRIYARNIALIAARNNIVPGSSAAFQVTRASGTATRMELSGTYQERDDKNHSIAPQLVYEGDRLRVDAALAYSNLKVNYRNAQPDGSGEGLFAGFTASLSPISWQLERSGPDQSAWKFQQLSGGDLYTLANWSPFFPTANVIASAANNQPEKKKYIGHLNAQYTTDWTLPTFFKAGFKVQEEIYSILTGRHSWSYVGPKEAILRVSPFEFDPSLVGDNLFSRGEFQWPDRSVIRDLMASNPEFFVKSPADSTNALNTAPRRYAKEQINAGYLMGNTQLGRLTVQGGARVEETRTAARIYERGALRTRFGDYRNTFWSGAAKYRLRENIMASVNYSESIQRPDFGNMSGVLTVNDDAMTGNIPNPNLRPEHGKNYTARIEYYLKAAGIVSAGIFRRDITDLHFQRNQITAEELGVGADYPGYLFTSWDNGESFRIEGYELEYSQQLRMLPGVLRGLGVFANYTHTTNNNVDYSYGTSPSNASAGVSFTYRKFGFNLRGSQSRDTLTAANVYRKGRTIVGVNASYQLSRNLSMYVSGRNIFNSPIETYRRDLPDHQTAYGRFSAAWSIGFEGRL